MDEKRKMSEFGDLTLPAARSAGAGVVVLVPGRSNNLIPATEFASASDLSGVQASLTVAHANIETLFREIGDAETALAAL